MPKRIHIEIPEDLHKKLKIYSTLKGITIIELVNQAIKEKLEKVRKK